jgi:hypothetical protein
MAFASFFLVVVPGAGLHTHLIVMYEKEERRWDGSWG